MPKTHFVISFEEAFAYLVQRVTAANDGYLDSDEEYKALQEILSMLIQLLLNKNSNYNDVVYSICNQLKESGFTDVEARDICDITLNLIANRLLEFIPGLGNELYNLPYTFIMVNFSDVRISVESRYLYANKSGMH